MAQRLLGIDLGAHTVKVAELEVGFRTVKLVKLQTLPVPVGPEPDLERSLGALAQLELDAESLDMVAVGVPGEVVLSRVLDVPFTDPKRVTAVVAGELADDIPWDLEDVVFDHHTLPGNVGKVAAVAMRSDVLGRMLEELEARQIDPRAMPPAAMAYGRLAWRVEPEGASLVVDLGHRRTNVCLVVDGRPLLSRTISRGGSKISEAFRAAFQLPLEEAEQLKEQEALLYAGDESELSERSGVFARVTAEAMAPLLREVRLSAEVFGQHAGQAPQRVLLCGGTSLMHGIESYLSRDDVLGLPCKRVSLHGSEEFDMGNLGGDGAVIGAQALSLCLDVGGRRSLDLRQGEFAYRTDSSVFREKLFALAVSVVLVLVFLAGNAFTSIYALRAEEKVLKAQLRKASQQVFGRPMNNPRTVSRRVKLGSREAGASIPAKTAFDVLHLLSSRIPAKIGEGESEKKVALDITRLDIRSGKTLLNGTADSRQEIGEIVKSLEADPCFSKVASGKISGVAEGKKQFSLTIATECF